MPLKKKKKLAEHHRQLQDRKPKHSIWATKLKLSQQHVALYFPSPCSNSRKITNSHGGCRLDDPKSSFAASKFSVLFNMYRTFCYCLVLRLKKSVSVCLSNKIIKHNKDMPSVNQTRVGRGRVFSARTGNPQSEPDERIKSPISARNNVACKYRPIIMHRYGTVTNQRKSGNCMAAAGSN